MKTATKTLLCALLLTWPLLATAQTTGDETQTTTPTIVLTTETSVGDTIWLSFETDDWEDPIIEGLIPTGESTFAGNQYTVTSPTIKLMGEITDLVCQEIKLTAIDLSGISCLQTLNCSNNQLTELNIGDNTSLSGLYCQQNKLQQLDLSKCKSLYEVYCFDNELQSFKLGESHPSFTVLKAANNQLTAIDLSGCPNVKVVDLGTNNIEHLDLAKNVAITWLLVANNKLTDIDLSAQTKLVRLDCYNNQLSALDLSKLEQLTVLAAESNQLQEIDVSHCPKLQVMSVEHNSIKTIDLSHNLELKSLWCIENRIYPNDMQALVTSLLQKEGAKLVAVNTHSDKEQNVILKAQVAEATAKGWTVYDFNPETKDLIPYEGSDTTFLHVTLSVGEGGTAKVLDVTDPERIPFATEIKVEATPNEGYELESIKVGDQDITQDKVYLVTKDVEITVTFRSVNSIADPTKRQELTITPNPARDLARVYGLKPYSDISIYTQEGKRMATIQADGLGHGEIDLSTYPSGKYLVIAEEHSGWLIVR
ncbi:hypothetical protein [uncultured Porphyromonas sp.]|uniref:leucine-rich repeat domain-containing protein n=1 Tax=uncultured Porphyromonas sp. TaxID=159274 RepID=UPI0025DC1D29|nr:hypothetical protein [uncultured Porphyromonas sp.]